MLIFSATFVIATAIAYSLTLPLTVAYEQSTYLSNLAYKESLSTQLLEAQAVLTQLQASLSEETSKAVADPVETPPSSVPFYSQFADISSPSWQKVGCGIASLAMIIDYYKPAVAVDQLLNEGIRSGAYIDSAGWSHAGLIALSEHYGLSGSTIGLYEYSMDDAFLKLTEAVAEGPVMVSVHYTFQPTNPIPHLAVITDVKDGLVYYNDPAEAHGGGSITAEQFKSAWKKRYIAIRPTA